MKVTSNTEVHYMRAITAAALIPVREQDTNKEYLTDIETLGLCMAEYPSKEFNEPIRPAAKGKLDGWDNGYFTPTTSLLSLSECDDYAITLHWVSTAFGNYTPGHLIISAPGTCIAAVTAVIQSEQWLHDNRAHWFTDEWDKKTKNRLINPDYKEAHQSFWISLFDDLRKIPERRRHLIIEGSE